MGEGAPLFIFDRTLVQRSCSTIRIAKFAFCYAEEFYDGSPYTSFARSSCVAAGHASSLHEVLAVDNTGALPSGMAKDKKHAKISLEGYHHGPGGITLKRLPHEPAARDIAFHQDIGGVDEFRQVGWISMNTREVWGLDEEAPVDVPDMTPLFINVRGD